LRSKFQRFIFNKWPLVTFQTIPFDHSENTTTIAIIGGGFSGAAVAYHLATSPKSGAVRIVVFEPREKIGKGAAYDTADPVHRINVPAARMSLLPGEPGHFAQWLEANDAVADDPAAVRPDGTVFPRRSVFGDYVYSSLRPLLSAGLVRHVHAQVTQVRKQDGGWRITGSNGAELTADIVVIATTHPTPAPPAVLTHTLAAHPRFIADPTKAGALSAIRADDRVLVVGNGLTSADVIASLKHQGHRGSIVALSRRGLRSSGHAPFAQEPFGDFLTPPPKTASELLARIRVAIRAAREQGLTWHPVLDQVRAQGTSLWKLLAVEERRRIVRHLRSYWDVHRFRIAPQVEDVLEEAAAAQRLETLAASIHDVRLEGEVIEVSVRPKGSRKTSNRQFDAVVVTTGPAHGQILSSQNWLKQMADRHNLHVDPTGLGLACNDRSEALSANLIADQSLLIVGPLARGHFGELMGLPQVSEHAVFVADRILEAIQPAEARHDSVGHHSLVPSVLRA